jgi:hypothetical protein
MNVAFFNKVIGYIRERIRIWRARRLFRRLVKKGMRVAKEKGLKPEDFGGPF